MKASRLCTTSWTMYVCQPPSLSPPLPFPPSLFHFPSFETHIVVAPCVSPRWLSHSRSSLPPLPLPHLWLLGAPLCPARLSSAS